MMRKILFSSFIFLLCTSIFLLAVEADTKGAELGKWTMDYDAAKKLAAKEQKPILINFSGSDWCGWCKLMEKKVFSQKEWQDYAKKNLVMVLLDFPNDTSLVPKNFTDRNSKLKEAFGVEGFPSFVYVDCDGETELGRLGASRDKTPAMFIKELTSLSKYCVSELERYTRTLKPKEKAAYLKIMDQMKAQNASLKESKATIAAANATVREAEEELDSLKQQAQEFRASQKGKKELAKYKSLKTDLEKAQKEMEDWIKSKPERSQEATKKFESMNSKISDLRDKLAEY